MSPQRRRRDALRTGVCLLGSALAGCLAGPSEILEPGEPSVTLAGWTLTIGNVSVQRSVVRSRGPHADPYYVDDGQFVVADAVVSGDDAPDPTELNLFVETDTIDRSERVNVKTQSNQARRNHRFGFPVPVSPEPNEGAIVWDPDYRDPVRWGIPDGVLWAITRPPIFELNEFSVNNPAGDGIEIFLVVENRAPVDGTFIAEVGDKSVSDRPEVFVDVPGGATAFVSRSVGAEFRGREELTVVLQWRNGTLERTVQKS